MRHALLLASLLLADVAYGQTAPANAPPPPAAVAAQAWGFTSRMTPYEFWLTLVIVLFGLVNILCMFLFFRKHVEKNSEVILRYVVIIAIISGSLILVTAGYNNEQIAPAFGLFGTIIGYILGRLSSGKDGEAKPEPQPNPPPSPAPQ